LSVHGAGRVCGRHLPAHGLYKWLGPFVRGWREKDAWSRFRSRFWFRFWIRLRLDEIGPRDGRSTGRNRDGTARTGQDARGFFGIRLAADRAARRRMRRRRRRMAKSTVKKRINCPTGPTRRPELIDAAIQGQSRSQSKSQSRSQGRSRSQGPKHSLSASGRARRPRTCRNCRRTRRIRKSQRGQRSLKSMRSMMSLRSPRDLAGRARTRPNPLYGTPRKVGRVQAKESARPTSGRERVAGT
jgi:hypothetical protein